MRRATPPHFGRVGPVLLLTLCFSLLLTGCLPKQPAAPEAFQAALKAAASARPAPPQTAYGKLPLAFEANQGQSDPQVKFLARGQGYSLFLTETEAVLTLRPPTPDPQPPSVLRMQLVGANSNPQVTGQAELPGRINYFLGNDPSQWRTNIPTFAKVRYANVYPGVDLVYYGNLRQLEYDLVVAPGVDPAVIRVAFDGADELSLDAQGNLTLQVASGTLRFQKPRIYQEVNGQRREIEGGYVLVEPPTPGPQAPIRTVGFQVMAYDKTLPLIVDPGLEYSTFLGGSAEDQAHAVAVDAAGNVFVAGVTYSRDFPTTPGSYQATVPTRICSPIACPSAFVAKLDPTGSALVYATYIGGSVGTNAWGVALDAAGNAYVTGQTSALDFPTTPGAVQPTYAGGFDDAFVTKLDPTGSHLVYSTFLGGGGISCGPLCSRGGDDYGYGIAVDIVGNAYVTGWTDSFSFPGNCLFPSHCSAPYSADAFVTMLDPTGSRLVYSIWLGGSWWDQGNGIAVDRDGNAYVAGATESDDFLTTPGAFQRQKAQCNTLGCFEVFVAKLDPAGSALVYSTYIEGTTGGGGRGLGIAVDPAGHAYVTGNTTSPDFPVTPDAFQVTYRGAPCRGQPCGNAFVATLNRTGSALRYATYLGGQGGDRGYGITLDPSGNIVVAGSTTSPDFPTTPGAIQPTSGGGTCYDHICEDAFVAKFSALTTPEVTLTVNQPAFRRGEQLTLTASVVPGRSAVTADTYVAVLLPHGSLLFLQGDGSLTTDLRPIVSNWAVSPFIGQVFAYTFTGGEPLGNYAWLAAFTDPGTLNIIGNIAWVPFVVVNP